MKPINRILFREIKPHAWRLVLILILILIGVGFGALVPWPFKVLIDNILGSEPLDKTTWVGSFLAQLTPKEVLGGFIVLVYFLSNALKSLFEFFASASTKKMSKHLVLEFSEKAFENLQKMNIRYFKNQNIGDYLYRLSYDVSAFGNLLEDGLLPIATNILYVVVTVAIMLWVNVKLALISLTIMPVLILGMKIFNKTIDRATNRSESSNSMLFSFIEEVLNQLKIIQAFNQQKRQTFIFSKRQDASLTEELNVFGLDFLLDLMIGLVIALGYAIVLAYGIKAVFAGALSAGLLIVFIFYMDNLAYPIINLLTGITSWREQKIKVDRIYEFFTPHLHMSDTGTMGTIGDSAITFDKVTVYGEEQVPILDNVSFKIPQGKKTVIVGVSGSGKTTLVSLILRFLEPDKGRITIGGNDIAKYSATSLREAITYVPQEVVLFNDSIYNNIAFGNESVGSEDITRAATLAEADHFIRHIPEGYDFVVGESGSNLSGGQRQRILLARAFLRTQAKIAIFDEPISALDVKTRAAIIKSIEKFCQGKTTIIISNILDIVEKADHVILLNEGSVVHTGSGSSLQEGHILGLILRS